MTADLVERDVRRTAARWAFIQRVATIIVSADEMRNNWKNLAEFSAEPE